LPTFNIEDGLLLPADALIAGVDEVGRGSLAGPVMAAAIILDRSKCLDDELRQVDDSKRLSKKNREAISSWIYKVSTVGIGFVDREGIDQLNILWASLLAMKRAIDDVQKNLDRPLDAVLIDGNRLPALNCRGYAIVQGDKKSFSIAAASIVAKIARDRFMLQMAKTYPQYGWEKNMGYGTRYHMEALKKYGVTDQHRRSFRPIAETLESWS
jgi:ribonuclease HII